MKYRNVAAPGTSSTIAGKAVAALLTACSAFGLVLTAMGVLLSLFRLIWYPVPDPWLMVGVYALGVGLAVWSFNTSISAFKNPKWSKLFLVAMAAIAIAALMLLGRYLGER
jgi:phosphoglycerol transferase MdoB-like AlkP superfamily enzyme